MTKAEIEARNALSYRAGVRAGTADRAKDLAPAYRLDVGGCLVLGSHGYHIDPGDYEEGYVNGYGDDVE